MPRPMLRSHVATPIANMPPVLPLAGHAHACSALNVGAWTPRGRGPPTRRAPCRSESPRSSGPPHAPTSPSRRPSSARASSPFVRPATPPLADGTPTSAGSKFERKLDLSVPPVRARYLALLEDTLHPRAGKASAAQCQHVRTLSPLRDNDEIVKHADIVLHETIGIGSFGLVRRGTWNGVDVAVKQCKVGTPGEAEMLSQEIRYLQKLRHPHLVSFLGHCQHEPHVLLLIEFMSCGSLWDLIFKKKTPLEFRAKVHTAWQIAEGLTYLHGRSVLHRDLKTANVLLDDQLRCKICDFGLTVTLERTHLTVMGLQGSPRYMAPEQFSTNARLTLTVDVWQLGCLMLELFCSTVPFARCVSLKEIATELVQRKRPPAIPSRADARARIVIRSCLRMHPAHRPEAALLEDVLGGFWKECLDAEWEKALGADGTGNG
eukprot:TRINITY_DN69036_c0_g1_i1.p1 TRINITY_DN69036_c0_g1~~TRINITY_DN69036_c0_g1_i1.p1  ORF type:complete len:433 (+),score=56.26 TRINITY_DN69036_c0_g1_i1:26-1324(+)